MYIQDGKEAPKPAPVPIIMSERQREAQKAEEEKREKEKQRKEEIKRSEFLYVEQELQNKILDAQNQACFPYLGDKLVCRAFVRLPDMFWCCVMPCVRSFLRVICTFPYLGNFPTNHHVCLLVAWLVGLLVVLLVGGLVC